ncbi:MAG: calcium/sodium antiporter [Lachnospiraceae bacterium]|nr:calcium/sodium antiporter [Lachnospiraceae bacterium]
MLVPVLLFILGLACLIFGGDWFVDGAVGIANRLRLPEILIGATVVSIGTTLPEVMVSAQAAALGHGQIAYGNAIGSVICNTALILAVTIAIKPAKAERKDIYLSSVFFFIAAAIYMFSAYVLKAFTRWIGIVLLVTFVIYMILSVGKSLKISKQNKAIDITPAGQDVTEKKSWKDNIVVIILMLVVGAALISVGADLLIDNGIIIAQALGVPESVIALTFVALGTSLPELVTAITSLIKGHGSLSLGNIIGANLFNLVLVSGISITISPFGLPEGKTIAGINSSLIVDIPLMLLVMLIIIIPVLIRNKLSRVQGIILLLMYASFCVYQFVF